MGKRKTKTQKELMEQFKISLTNVQTQPVLKSTMATFGYAPKVIAEGQTIYDKADKAFIYQNTEASETIAAKGLFDEVREELDEKYTIDRKKAKIVFKTDEIVLKQLGLLGTVPFAHVEWVDTMETLYNGIIADKSVQTKLVRLNLTLKDAQNALLDIKKMEAARADYYREIGESEDATKQKEKALAEIQSWMSEFYAVAKIAMEDQPQLLESLGVYVRS